MKKIFLLLTIILSISSCTTSKLVLDETKGTPEYHIKILGNPDNIDVFTTNNYHTKTLIWYCASGKYRSYTYEKRFDIFRQQSYYYLTDVYTSTCINNY